MPQLSDKELIACAELLEQSRDLYEHPAWRRLMEGVQMQADATYKAAAMHILESNEPIDPGVLYEYRGRWQALHFLHEYGTSQESIGKAAKEILIKRSIHGNGSVHN